ncbi:hypothetical protein ACEZHO_005360 [Escherichia coli]
MNQLLIDRVVLFGTEREREEYKTLCDCTNPDWFFKTHSAVLKGRASNFHPKKSRQYLKVYSSNWRTRCKTKEWWQWLEDFRPDAGLEEHRFLIDPMANVFDCKSKTFVIPQLDPDKREDSRYVEFWLERPADAGKVANDDVITRGRLIAYRYPHLVWRDYLFHRYNYLVEKDGLLLPDYILRSVQGIDSDGNMVATGFYSKAWNRVGRRFEDGKVMKKVGRYQRKKALRPMEIDHKNRDKFNDLPCNIRWADRDMNLVNRNIQKLNKHSQKVNRHSQPALP